MREKDTRIHTSIACRSHFNRHMQVYAQISACTHKQRLLKESERERRSETERARERRTHAYIHKIACGK